MSALEIIIALFGGIIAGTTFSILVSKYLKPEFPGSDITSKPTKSIPEIGKKFEVEQARLRYKTLKLEKELHTDALGRVFQAEGEGRITKKERDLLSDRYREQIRTLDNSLQDSELILEASELENLHEELTNLFSQKLNQVERRLNELTTKLETVKTPINSNPCRRAGGGVLESNLVHKISSSTRACDFFLQNLNNYYK